MKDKDRMDVCGHATIVSMASSTVGFLIAFAITSDIRLLGIAAIAGLVICFIGCASIGIAYRKEIKDIEKEYEKKRQR